MIRVVLLLLCLLVPAGAAAQTGEPLPDVTFRDEQGRRLSLADFRGRVVLLDFWATWCAPCVAEIPALDRLQRRYGDQGLAVVPIAIDRAGAIKVRAFYRQRGIQALPIFVDDDRQAVQALGIEAAPSSLLIGRDGRLIARFEGPHDWEAEEELLQRSISGREGDSAK